MSQADLRKYQRAWFDRLEGVTHGLLTAPTGYGIDRVLAEHLVTRVGHHLVAVPSAQQNCWHTELDRLETPDRAWDATKVQVTPLFKLATWSDVPRGQLAVVALSGLGPRQREALKRLRYAYETLLVRDLVPHLLTDGHGTVTHRYRFLVNELGLRPVHFIKPEDLA